jgi:uncharacterized protein YcfJ
VTSLFKNLEEDRPRGNCAELRDKQQRQFHSRMVATIEKRDSKKNGALIGFATGGILGGLAGVGMIRTSGDSASYAAGALVGGLIWGGIGAAVGTGINALIDGRHVIYAKSKTTVSIRPAIGHDRRGVVFSLQR